MADNNFDINNFALSVELQLSTGAAYKSLDAFTAKAEQAEKAISQAAQKAFTSIREGVDTATKSIEQFTSAFKDASRSITTIAPDLTKFYKEYKKIDLLHDKQLRSMRPTLDFQKKDFKHAKDVEKTVTEQFELQQKATRLGAEHIEQSGILNKLFDVRNLNIMGWSTQLMGVLQAYYLINREVEQFHQLSFRAYGTQFQLAEQAAGLVRNYNIFNETAYDTINTLIGMKVPREELSKYAKTVALAQRWTGLGDRELIAYSNHLRAAGFDSAGAEKQIGWFAAAMQQAGLSTQDTSKIMSESFQTTATQMEIAFGPGGRAMFDRWKGALQIALKGTGADAAALGTAIEGLYKRGGLAAQQLSMLTGTKISKPEDYSKAILKIGEVLNARKALLDQHRREGKDVQNEAMMLQMRMHLLAEQFFGGSDAAVEAMMKFAGVIKTQGGNLDKFNALLKDQNILIANTDTLWYKFQLVGSKLKAALLPIQEWVSEFGIPFLDWVGKSIDVGGVWLRQISSGWTPAMKQLAGGLTVVGVAATALGGPFRLLAGLAGVAFGELTLGRVALAGVGVAFNILTGRIKITGDTFRAIGTHIHAAYDRLKDFVYNAGFIEGIRALGVAVRRTVVDLLGSGMFADIARGLGTTLRRVGDFLAPQIHAIFGGRLFVDLARGFVVTLHRVGDYLIPRVRALFGAIGAGIGPVFSHVWTTIRDGGVRTLHALGGVSTTISKTFVDAYTKAYKFVVSLMGVGRMVAISLLGSLGGFARDAFSYVLATVSNLIDSVNKSAMGDMARFAKNAFATVAEHFADIGIIINDKLKAVAQFAKDSAVYLMGAVGNVGPSLEAFGKGYVQFSKDLGGVAVENMQKIGAQLKQFGSDVHDFATAIGSYGALRLIGGAMGTGGLMGSLIALSLLPGDKITNNMQIIGGQLPIFGTQVGEFGRSIGLRILPVSVGVLAFTGSLVPIGLINAASIAANMKALTDGDTLQRFGTAVGEFAAHAGTFAGLKLLSDAFGVTGLTGALALIGRVDMVPALANMRSMTPDLPKFGAAMGEFTKHVGTFGGLKLLADSFGSAGLAGALYAVGGVNLDPALENMRKLIPALPPFGQALAAFSGTIGTGNTFRLIGQDLGIGGLSGTLAIFSTLPADRITDKLQKIGSALPQFGKDLAAFSGTIGTGNTFRLIGQDLGTAGLAGALAIFGQLGADTVTTNLKKIGDALPTFGTKLGEFATKAGGAGGGAALILQDFASGGLAAALEMFALMDATAAINNINQLGDTLPGFGATLRSFVDTVGDSSKSFNLIFQDIGTGGLALALKQFGSVDAEPVIKNMKALGAHLKQFGEDLAGLTSSVGFGTIPLIITDLGIDGLSGALYQFGKVDITNFEEHLERVGKKLPEFGVQLTKFTDATGRDAITTIISAFGAKGLAGALQAFGQLSLEPVVTVMTRLSEHLPTFGRDLAKFAKEVGPEVFELFVAHFGASGLAGVLDEFGKLAAGNVIGNMDSIGLHLKAFGTHLGEFASEVGFWNSVNMNQFASSLLPVVKAFDAIGKLDPNVPSRMDTLGPAVKNYGANLRAFAELLDKDISNTLVAAVKPFGDLANAFGTLGGQGVKAIEHLRKLTDFATKIDLPPLQRLAEVMGGIGTPFKSGKEAIQDFSKLGTEVRALQEIAGALEHVGTGLKAMSDFAATSSQAMLQVVIDIIANKSTIAAAGESLTGLATFDTQFGNAVAKLASASQWAKDLDDISKRIWKVTSGPKLMTTTFHNFAKALEDLTKGISDEVLARLKISGTILQNYATAVSSVAGAISEFGSVTGKIDDFNAALAKLAASKLLEFKSVTGQVEGFNATLAKLAADTTGIVDKASVAISKVTLADAIKHQVDLAEVELRGFTSMINRYADLLQIAVERVEDAIVKRAIPAMQQARAAGVADVVKTEMIVSAKIKDKGVQSTNLPPDPSGIYLPQILEILTKTYNLENNPNNEAYKEDLKRLIEDIASGMTSGGHDLATSLNAWGN